MKTISLALFLSVLAASVPGPRSCTLAAESQKPVVERPTADRDTKIGDRAKDKVEQVQDKLERLPIRDGRLKPVSTLELDRLFDCLSASTEGDVLQKYIDRLKSNPGGLVEMLLQQALTGVTDNFDQLMQGELASLERGDFAVDFQGDRVLGVARKLPRSECLFDHVHRLKPADGWQLVKFKKAIEATLTEKSEDLKQRVEPKLHKGIGAVFTRILTSDNVEVLLTERELQFVANGVYAEFLIEQLGRTSDEVDRYTQSLPAASVPQSLTDALSGSELWPEEFARRFIIEVVRAMAHKAVDNKDPGMPGYLVEQAVSLLQTTEDTAVNISEGVCGLVPEAGAGICAILLEIADLAWNHVAIPAIADAITDKLHEEVDVAIEEIKANDQRPLDGRPVAKALRDIISQDIIAYNADDSVRLAVHKYDTSVRRLAEAVVSR